MDIGALQSIAQLKQEAPGFSPVEDVRRDATKNVPLIAEMTGVSDAIRVAIDQALMMEQWLLNPDADLHQARAAAKCRIPRSGSARGRMVAQVKQLLSGAAPAQCFGLLHMHPQPVPRALLVKMAVNEDFVLIVLDDRPHPEYALKQWHKCVLPKRLLGAALIPLSPQALDCSDHMHLMALADVRVAIIEQSNPGLDREIIEDRALQHGLAAIAVRRGFEAWRQGLS